MGGLVAAERAGEIRLDFALGVAAVLLAELHADPRGPLALRTLGRHPDDASGDWQLLVLTHQVEQHENLVTEAIVTAGRDEEDRKSTRLNSSHSLISYAV